MKHLYKKLTGLVVVMLIPLMGHAGIMSFVSGLFQSANAETTTSDDPQVNSQNMPLLHAAVNSNPNAVQKEAGDVAIISQSALLAEAGPSGTAADIEDRSNGQISLYVVKEGDSLSKIAKLFGVSVNTIIWANNIKGGTINEGQTLVILPITGIQYTVKQGDTLKGIVAKYKADLNEVLDYNSLTPGSVLTAGDIVTIPDAEIPQLVTPSKPKNNPQLTSQPHDTNGPYYPGYYTRPIDGGVRTQGLHGYNAVDLGTPVGTAIHASAAGTVLIAATGGWNHGYGNYVVVSHPNGTQTVYAHASKVIVTVGEHVEQGQLIALSGSSGKSTGPHIHFEVRGAKNPF